jgi:hypothetical protein
LQVDTSHSAGLVRRSGGLPAGSNEVGAPSGVRRAVLAVLASLALGLAAATVTACGTEPEQETTPAPTSAATLSPPSASPSPSPSATEPASTPQLSWDWIRTREYRDWVQPPGWEERRTTGSPHGEAKVIYIDPAVAATLGSGETRFPAGATIVKEGYDAGGDLVILAAMQRRPDEGWFFAEYGSDGSVIEEGDDPPLCTQCHRGAQDGVLAFTLD